MKHIIKSLLLVFITLTVGHVYADEISLDVKGKITNFTDKKAGVYHFSEKDFLKLKPATIKTGTNWTPVTTFVGARLSDVLKIVGATGSMLELHALDDYMYAVPATDADKYGVILAYSMDGKRIGRVKFGPLFVIYPRDQFPNELRLPSAESKFVWQLSSIVVR